jgi:hypothetical protein
MVVDVEIAYGGAQYLFLLFGWVGMSFVLIEL